MPERDDDDPAGREVGEVEVKPEMIEAGVRALCQPWSEFTLDEELVASIYRAMEDSKRIEAPDPPERTELHEAK